MQRATTWLSVVSIVGLSSLAVARAQEVPVAPEPPVTTTPPETPASNEPVVSELTFPVTVRKTGSATIAAKVFENPRVAQGVTILDVHGLASTGRVFDPLTKALFDEPTQGAKVKRVVTIDLIGHGGSSLPTGLPAGVNFGALTIDDNVETIIQSIEALRARGVGPQLVTGHSMGSLAIAAAQQTLLSRGSSFAKLGVISVLLIAPVPSHARPWTQPVSAEASTFTKYVVVDPTKGIYLSVPSAPWLELSFIDRTGKLTAKTPTPAEAEAAGYIAVEPLFTLLQLLEMPLLGAPRLQRPTIDAGVFAAANGTRLSVVSFSEDNLVTHADARDFYAHLSGDATGVNYLPITAPDAVHNITITNPTLVIEAMKVLYK